MSLHFSSHIWRHHSDVGWFNDGLKKWLVLIECRCAFCVWVKGCPSCLWAAIRSYTPVLMSVSSDEVWSWRFIGNQWCSDIILTATSRWRRPPLPLIKAYVVIPNSNCRRLQKNVLKHPLLDSDWISAAWSLVSLLHPRMSFQISASVYCLMFAFGCRSHVVLLLVTS